MRYKLGDIAEVSAGQGAPQGDNNYCDDGIPFVKAGNLQELLLGADIDKIQKVNADVAKKHKLRLYKRGSVLFAKSGMSCLKGYVYILPKDAYVVSHLACISPLSVDSDYLRYYFQFHKPNQLVKDAAYPSISLSEIADMGIEVPNGEKIKTIIASLKKAEGIISARKQQLSALDTLIKARFVEMFGSIHESKIYPYVPIKELAKVTSGGTPSREHPEYWDNGSIGWIKTTELQNCVLTDSEEKITELGMSNSSAKIVPPQTILIAMYGQGKTRGMTAYLQFESTTNQACACILPSTSINSKYLWHYMMLSYDKLRELAKGGNQPNLNGNMIKDFAVLLPPNTLQSDLVRFAEQVDKSKVAVQKALDEAQLLFNSLMQKYFG